MKTLKETENAVPDGPDVIRTHDLPVISRAHHRAMLRAQESSRKFTLITTPPEFLIVVNTVQESRAMLRGLSGIAFLALLKPERSGP